MISSSAVQLHLRAVLLANQPNVPNCLTKRILLMMSVIEVKRWLATIPDDGFVAIDDGGLALVEVTTNGEPLVAYLELGGACESED